MATSVAPSFSLKRLMSIGKPFWVSPMKYHAFGLLTAMLVLLVAVNAANVYTSHIAGRFMTALQARNVSDFYWYLVYYCSIILLATPIVVYYQFLRTKLSLVWRRWLTQHLVSKYFANRAYYRLASNESIDNPDERMTQDVETFCNCAVGLFISLLDASIAVVSFTMVLLTISGPLTAVVLGYSLVGSLLTVWIGSKLVGYNCSRIKAEADLRYAIADVRRDVESIAFYSGEKRVKLHILKALVESIRNLEQIMILNRNLGFFTTSYNWLVGLIPAAVTAPFYFSGAMDFGDITQAGMAFGQIFGGLTLFISQFNGIASFAANIDRLGTFVDALDKEAKPAAGKTRTRKVDVVDSDGLQLTDVTVLTPKSDRVLVTGLNFELTPGTGLLIMGPSGSGKSSLLRAIAGLWSAGDGTIARPPLKECMFLPQKPHIAQSTLRDALSYPKARTNTTDAQLLATLKLLTLDHLPLMYGGLDTQQQWRDNLSPGEQQRLSFARVLLARPRYVFLDESTSALDEKNERLLYTLLASTGTTVLSVGHRSTLLEHHQQVLMLAGDGGWSIRSTKEVDAPASDTNG
ncbi:MAG: ABC transporter ATP-binding protein/permease [Candidatus Obscuribacterales bacterium]|nr:ABC transporter ATP-binding protein/permease [Candidatus Obscuribacterales bacterium]